MEFHLILDNTSKPDMNHQSTDTFMKKNEMSNTRIRVKTTLQDKQQKHLF